MLYSVVLLFLGLLLFWWCSRGRSRPCGELPVSLPFKKDSLLSRVLGMVGKSFFFLFCFLWISTVCLLVFPKAGVPSWMRSLYPEKTTPHISYSATLFIVDRSSSMKSSFDGSVSRLDFAKATVQTLIQDVDREGGGTDTFGLLACARIAPILVPLTRDRTFFMNELAKIVPEENEQLNGTALGYALFKGVYLMEALVQYAAQNRMETLSKKARSIVIVTDGLEDVSPYDKEDPYRSLHMKEALMQAQALGVRVWYVVVAPSAQDLVTSVEKKTLFDLAASTGGGYVEVLSLQDQEREMKKIAHTIRDSEEHIEERVDETLLVGLLYASLCLSLVCMRFSERARWRIG